MTFYYHKALKSWNKGSHKVTEAATVGGALWKKGFLKISQNSQKCEFCEILKNIFFTEHIQVAASEVKSLYISIICHWLKFKLKSHKLINS